ncbi:MAG: MarR family transcriptional regulator [Lachnospiraceae bacterium]|nr:MarR family transcriptional regulator [Lachnospiraceae bacterium]
MDFKEVIQHKNIDFTGIEESYFLLGLLSAFDNRFQSVADRLIGEISWKQFFAIICINLCKESPSLKELADIMGSSHQNTKQILLKLEKKGFVAITQDPADRRKQRISLTEQCLRFCAENDERSMIAITTMFANIPKEQLRITIRTIMQMEENLKGLCSK